MLRHLDLFSGIGGFALGLERTGHFKTVGFCESDAKCRKVLQKHWPNVPIFNDFRTMNYDGPVDIITGGYPCQPFSVAGQRRGEEDDRDLWPAMFALIKKHRPAWVIGENVAGHISMGLDRTIANLEAADYAVRVFIIPAIAVDAPHRRDRLWIVANSNSMRKPQSQGVIGNIGGRAGHGSNEILMANPDSLCGQGVERKNTYQKEREIKGKRQARPQDTGYPWRWPPESGFCRVVDGLPGRVDRVKQLGNAIVPEIVTRIGYAIAATG